MTQDHLLMQPRIAHFSPTRRAIVDSRADQRVSVQGELP